jgi:hypothetical protein
VADQKRKLVIEVLGNAKDAAKALGDVRSDTDRAAERFTSFGTVALAASAVGAVGLYKLANAAGDYGEAQSAASVIFGDAVDIVTEFGEAASETAGMSKKAAVDGANTFGTFGKSAGLAGEDLAGFSTEMVQLAGDLASFKNTSPEQAIQAIGSALRGESEPIRQYGVLLDDATLKQRAMTLGIYEGTGALTPQQKVLAAQAEILAQTSDAQGDYSRTSDSLANQQRTLTAEFENLKVGIGQGVLPMMSSLVGGASDVLGVFSELSPGTQSVIGKLGGVVVVSGLVVGALSMVAGKALEARDRFTTLGTDGTRSLNNVGKAAAGLGAAGAALALYQMGQALNDATKDAVGLETAINKLQLAEGPDEVGAAIGEAAEATKGWIDDLRNVGNYLGGGMSDAGYVEVEGYRVELEKVGAVLDEIKARGDNELMAKTIEAFRAADTSAITAIGGVEGFNDTLDSYEENLETGKAASEDAAVATEEFGGAAVGAEQDLADLEEQVRSLTEGIQEMQGTFLSADQAQRALLDASQALVESLAENGKTLDINTAAGRKNRDALDDQVAASFELAQKQALLDTTGQTSKRTLQEQALVLANMRRDGIIPTGEAYLELLRTYELTPDAIETQVIADTEDAKRKAFDLAVQLANMPGVPAPLKSKIQTAINTGDYAEAERLLQQLSRERTAKIRVDALAGSFPIFGVLGLPTRAEGGPVAAGRPYLVGEEGPEIVIPKNAGTVLPNDVYQAVAGRTGTSLGSATSGAGGGVVVTVNFGGSVGMDPGVVIDAVEQGVAKGMQMPKLRRALVG